MESTSPLISLDVLRNSLLEVLAVCPADHCNPADCPLYCLRGLDMPRRLQWLRSLNRSDLEYLAIYHHVCMKLKLESGASVRAAIC